MKVKTDFTKIINDKNQSAVIFWIPSLELQPEQFVLVTNTLQCGIWCFLCVSDRCDRILIYIQTAVKMGFNIYMTADAWGYLCHGMCFKRVGRVHVQGNQFIRNETGGGIDVKWLTTKPRLQLPLKNNMRCSLWSNLFECNKDEKSFALAFFINWAVRDCGGAGLFLFV